jgi:hypothetical protein
MATPFSSPGHHHSDTVQEDALLRRARHSRSMLMAVSVVSSQIIRPGGRIVIVRPTRRR